MTGRILPVWLIVVDVISCATLLAIVALSVAPIVVSPNLIAILISAWLITICAIVSGIFVEIKAFVVCAYTLQQGTSTKDCIRWVSDIQLAVAALAMVIVFPLVILDSLR